ncbi:WD_REPEATS_REGION domain-containing protein [Nephila pilipes]|uniref:WD_REPEATS_REGION domain-containing protein n=1 Tax=Nephila pilipes TaxID=299642 RepID=A0A8X6QDC9_NEPPI|nr:WD_REPEATS_REGION domain-containing protein [Nephila pilipes]
MPLRYTKWMGVHDISKQLMFMSWFPDPRTGKGGIRITLMVLSIWGIACTYKCLPYADCSEDVADPKLLIDLFGILLYTVFGLLLINSIVCPNFYSPGLCVVNYATIMCLIFGTSFLLFSILFSQCYDCSRMVMICLNVMLTAHVYQLFFLYSYDDMKKNQKQFIVQYNKNLVNSRFITRMLKQVRLQSGKSEQVVKILDTADVCSLLFVAQKGTIVYRNLRLQEEAKFHWDLCSDLQKQNGGCLKSRRALFTVTDASYLNVSRHYCLSTTNRSLHFIHASPSAQWETFRLTDLPTVPTCLENNFQPTNKTKTCELFIGDHKGSIYVLKFFYPRTLLFARNYSLGTQVIRFQDLKHHENYIKYKLIKNVHNDIVDKIHCIPHLNILLSSSKLDVGKSIVLRDLTSSCGFQAYSHPLGVTCFDFNQTHNIIATGSKDFLVRVWEIKCSSRPDKVLEGHTAVIADVRIHEHMKRVLSLCKEGEMRLFDLKTGNCLHIVRIRSPFNLPQLQFGNSALHISFHDYDHILVTMNDVTTRICLEDLEEQIL